MTIGDQYERMLQALEYVTGETLETQHPRRTAMQFWMRAVITRHLYAAGWNDARIATVLNRDRASITYTRQRIAAALEMPRIYPDVVKLDNDFKRQYYELFGQNL